MRRTLALGFMVLGSTACRLGEPTPANVLVIIADDVSANSLAAWGGDDPPPTPHLDALAAESRVFDLAWSTPTCSPARAGMLTGRYPRRHGITAILRGESDEELPLSEVTLPELLERAPHRWSTSAVGKWHLSTPTSPSGARHPLLQGFGWWSGSLGNLGATPTLPDPATRDYNHWEKVLPDGSTVMRERFATVDTTDDALARATAMEEPWLLWTAYNAPHMPLTAPPEALAPVHLSADYHGETALYRANLVALDAEIGRLLDGLGPALRARTHVIFVADNGSPKFTDRRSKGTLFEDGLRVPLLVAGPAVGTPGHTQAPVHVVDLFPTIAELAGLRGPFTREPGLLARLTGEPLPIDGTSLVPLLADADATWPREILYTEWAYPNFAPEPRHLKRAARLGDYKLVSNDRGPDKRRFYDLRHDPDEHRPIEVGAMSTRAREAYARLSALLDADVLP